jgi:hypothetical protein
MTARLSQLINNRRLGQQPPLATINMTLKKACDAVAQAEQGRTP